MTDDLKLRQWDRCWPGNINLEVAVDEALARITDLEAKLQRLGRELNLAKYGEPDFAWEIHKNAVADLEARLAAAVEVQDRLMSERYQQYLRAEAAEANVNRLQEGEARLSLLLNETAQARDAAEAGEDALAEAVRRQIAFEAWWKTIGGICPEPLVDAPIKMRAALAAYEARRKG